MSFVTIEAFLARYGGSLAESDVARAQVLLDDACDMAQDVIGPTPTYEDGDDIPGGIITVVVTAVRRAFDNPMGLTGETIGNYTWQGGRSAGGGIYFTLQEKQTLRRAAGKLGVGQVTLEGYLRYVDRAEQYVDTTDGEPILYYRDDDPVILP